MQSVRIGGRLSALAVAGGLVWVGDTSRPRLHAVDPDGLRRVKRLRPRIGVGLDAMSASGQTLWAIATRQHKLFRLDARSGRPVGEPIPLPLTANANAVVADRDDVWVATTTPELDPGDQILRIDPASGQIEERLDVVDGVRRLLILDGGLWVLASQPARLLRIDLTTGDRDMIRLDGINAGDLAAGGGFLWATLRDNDLLERIDPETGDLVTVAVGRSPAGIAVQGGSVWVANVASSTLTRVDARAVRAREEIEVPLNPYELASDGEYILAASLAEGTLTSVAPAPD